MDKIKAKDTDYVVNNMFLVDISSMHSHYEHNNWRGAWNKALSDFWCNVKFS